MEQVGIYLRISEDPDGTQQATERQRQDCIAYATARSWSVADVFEDIDISAYQRTAKRPEFERMLEAIRTQRINGVLVWKMDRLSRRMLDFVRVDDAAEGAGAFICSIQENVNTREATGRFVAELLTAQARMESANISTRVKRAHQQLAKQGRPVVGGHRTFGYTKDYSAIVPAEAELIREATRRVLAGETVRGIAREWETRGVKSPAGGSWRHSTLRRLLMNPALSAQRFYGETLSAGAWPQILEPDETARLRAALSRRQTKGVARTYLLSGGIAKCGRCGGSLLGRRRPGSVRRYVCEKQPGMPNCGRLARVAEPIESVVAEMLFTALEGVNLTDYLSERAEGHDGALIAEIQRDEEAMLQLSRDFYAEQAISRAEFFAARDTLQQRLDRDRSRLGQRQTYGVLATLADAGRSVRKIWDEKPLEWRRTLLTAVIDHVEIMPAGKVGRAPFDATLVKPTWKV